MANVDLSHGNFSWVDLVTTDTARSRTFYEALLGWSSDLGETPDGGEYHMFRKDGRAVAGMIASPPGSQFPPTWVSYILVDDLDQVAGDTDGLGGTLLMPPRAVGPAGRMSMVRDPSGAAVGLWEAGEFTGAELWNAPGAVAWNELVTRDLTAATTFYEGLLGWSWEAADMPNGMIYRMGMVDGRPNAGAMAMTPEYPPETPAHWAVYFQVESVADVHARAQELGGRELVEPEMTAMGPISVIQDPAGAVFSLFEPRPHSE